MQAGAVERLRAVVGERAQEAALVRPELALARVAQDEHAERAVGDDQRQCRDRDRAVAERARELREPLGALREGAHEHGLG